LRLIEYLILGRLDELDLLAGLLFEGSDNLGDRLIRLATRPRGRQPER
jgi:hypothetical protein